MKQYRDLIIVFVILAVLIYVGLHLNKVNDIQITTMNTEIQSNEPSITVSPPLSVNKGDSFNVDIVVNPAGLNIAGAQFNMAFDPTLVSANNITDGSLFGTNQIFINGNIDNATGTIIGVACATPTYISSQGIIVSISMTANNSGVCQLSLSNVIIANQQANAITSQINNTSITIN